MDLQHVSLDGVKYQHCFTERAGDRQIGRTPVHMSLIVLLKATTRD